MGNEMCGTTQLQGKLPLNLIHKKYQSTDDTYIKVDQQYLKYPQKYAYILSNIRYKKIVFTDCYFDGYESAATVLGEILMMGQRSIPRWIRLNKLMGRNQINLNDWCLANKWKENGLKLMRGLNCILEESSLMVKIFKFMKISEEGMVIVYLPFYGSHDEPTQIIIDTNIPIKGDEEQYNYLFALPHQTTIATILLHKALAKAYGSYQKLNKVKFDQIYEMILGLPSNNLSSIQSQNFKEMIKVYRPNFIFKSTQLNLQTEHSEYVKITINTQTQLTISAWQPDNQNANDELAVRAEIVMELIDSECVRVGYASILQKYKTVMRYFNVQNQKVQTFLPKGNYILHIFTRSKKTTLVVTNIVVYSSAAVGLNYRKQSNDLHSHKMKMVQNIFIRNYNIKSNTVEGDGVVSYLVKDGYRHILCIKNQKHQNKNIKDKNKEKEKESRNKRVKVIIREQFYKSIKFEECQDHQIELLLLDGAKKFISFLKLTNSDLCNFYTITVGIQ